MKAKPMKAPKMVVPGTKGAAPKAPAAPTKAKPKSFNRFPPDKLKHGGGNTSY